MKHNQGSTIIEVTLIMPVLLMMMVLFITLLLGVLQQANVHSELMYYSAEPERDDKQGPSVAISVQGDKKAYSQQVDVTLIEGYGISYDVTQTIRISNVEENLRRWQMLGDLVTE